VSLSNPGHKDKGGALGGRNRTKAVSMSKGKLRFPTPSEIKRTVEAVQRSGLSVSAVRVSADAVYVQTRGPAEDVPPDNNKNEWDV
jgi:hypothetical protein